MRVWTSESVPCCGPGETEEGVLGETTGEVRLCRNVRVHGVGKDFDGSQNRFY